MVGGFASKLTIFLMTAEVVDSGRGLDEVAPGIVAYVNR